MEAWEGREEGEEGRGLFERRRFESCAGAETCERGEPRGEPLVGSPLVGSPLVVLCAFCESRFPRATLLHKHLALFHPCEVRRKYVAIVASIEGKMTKRMWCGAEEASVPVVVTTYERKLQLRSDAGKSSGKSEKTPKQKKKEKNLLKVSKQRAVKNIIEKSPRRLVDLLDVANLALYRRARPPNGPPKQKEQTKREFEMGVAGRERDHTSRERAILRKFLEEEPVWNCARDD